MAGFVSYENQSLSMVLTSVRHEATGLYNQPKLNDRKQNHQGVFTHTVGNL